MFDSRRLYLISMPKQILYDLANPFDPPDHPQAFDLGALRGGILNCPAGVHDRHQSRDGGDRRENVADQGNDPIHSHVGMLAARRSGAFRAQARDPLVHPV